MSASIPDQRQCLGLFASLRLRQRWRLWAGVLLVAVSAGLVACREWLFPQKVTADLARHLSEAPLGHKPIRVALLTINPEDKETKHLWEVLFASQSGIVHRWISPAEVREGALSQHDALIVPGGSGKEYERLLQAHGCDAIRRFVSSGGGYVGICGGAFLATARSETSLGLVAAKPLGGVHEIPGRGDVSVAQRGAGFVTVALTNGGQKLFDEPRAVLQLQYSSGPVLQPARVNLLPGYETLATYRTETVLHDFQQGTMIGTPAIVAAKYGTGYVVLFSPHPEMTPGLESMILRATKAVAVR